MSDQQLDEEVRGILSVFPDFGRVIRVAGHLAAHGHPVPDSRIRLSYIRIRGAPPTFGRRRVIRKKYHTTGIRKCSAQEKS